MTEGRAVTAVVDGRLDERMVERALEAAADAPPTLQVRDAVEKVIDVAETDPAGARVALWSLRGDRVTMERLESHLSLSAKRAIFALGAAIQLADAELASPEPDLRSRAPELLYWLEGGW
jgi:hypothetical protein